jgi:hypothetical protein
VRYGIDVVDRVVNVFDIDHRRGRPSSPKKARQLGITVDTMVSWQ